MRYEPNEPKESSYGLDRSWLVLSGFWLDHQPYPVELAGKDELQFGQFGQFDGLVVDLVKAPIRTFVG
ncbi:hypothetical protein F2Q70_00013421 [Brassica cretica]|uniref:Uncharacterized protein n=1 Tax=Brassica cretica TaxID=69181 RepID=A0A8S9MCW5_BRACR|nr:hypothetical protein F2Q70_00013421 [Brassica cretica]KAF3547578.1 hypothetical protein DY000_02009917 [Brassica cretica]